MKVTVAIALSALALLALCLWANRGRSASTPQPVRSDHSSLGATKKEAIRERPSATPPSPVVSPTEIKSRTSGAAARAVASKEDCRRARWEFWNTLKGLKQIRAQSSAEQYRRSAIQATARYLQLTESRNADFTQAAEAAIRDLATALKSRQQAMAQAPIGNATVQKLWKQQEDERHKAQRKAATVGLEAFLDQSPRHHQFRTDLDTWAVTIQSVCDGTSR